MCGIAGFIDFKNHSEKQHLQNMTDALVHRGPDSAGYEWFNKPDFQLGLGHRRLSIIDLSSAGAQPMNLGSLWITFNGEIYNFNEIKEQLLQKGHAFKSHSDTEVILHAYTEWGKDCLQYFIGMFAFVIYDSEKQHLFCARDRAGIKPFFYYWHNHLFLFSSELKAFHQHPNFEKSLNHDAIASFIQYGHVPTPHCIFNHGHKLPPGHFLEFDIHELKMHPEKIKLHQYWNVYDSYNQPKLNIEFAEAIEETEKLLKSAADYRMVSDVPVGVFLSGGYDSACLTALLQSNRSEPLKTYTIAVPDIGLNEAPYAKDVASYLGTQHHEYACTSKEAINLIQHLPHFYDEPFGDSSAIPTTLVCQMARKEVTVALSADAGDELFAGYNRYDYMMKFGSKIKNTPSIIRKSIAGLMNQIPASSVPYFNKTYNFHNRYEKLKGLLKNPSDHHLMMSLSRQFHDDELNHLLKFAFKESENWYSSRELKKDHYTPLSYIMAIDYQTYLLDDILQKVDRASMTVSLEAREPYLDHRLIEWAAKLPDHFKYHKGVKKHILKEITHRYIPYHLMNRPKMGFAIPFENWMMNELKERVLYYLNPERLKKQGVFNADTVHKMTQQFMSGKKEYGLKIWYLLMFEMWHEHWMENSTNPEEKKPIF